MTQSKLFCVEIWSPEFDLRAYSQITEFSHKEDYMDHENNIVELPAEIAKKAKKGDYIRIYNIFINDDIYVGIIKSFESEKEGSTKLKYSSFMSLVDIDMIIDWPLTSRHSVENFIALYIKKTYIDNPDSYQNIIGLEVKTTSSTPQTIKELEYPVCNFYDHVIIPAIYDHAIRLIITMDITGKKIVVSIGKSQKEKITIESDLPNITEKIVIIEKTQKTVNKIIVVNEETLEYLEFYRLNEDGSRITPVEFMVETIQIREDEIFEEIAKERADSIFAKIQFENLIEIECYPQDSLINPTALEIGQIVEIKTGNTIYNTILTGRETGEKIKLIFGTIRLEMTKILKGRA